jgi:hypothetical protein
MRSIGFMARFNSVSLSTSNKDSRSALGTMAEAYFFVDNCSIKILLLVVYTYYTMSLWYIGIIVLVVIVSCIDVRLKECLQFI